MRLIDHVYADTLRKIIANILHQIKDCESFVADKNYDDDEFKQSVRDEIPEKVKLLTPAILNLYRAFYLFVDDEIIDFVEKYKIVIPKEGDKPDPELDEQEEKIHNMAACMLSILDSLKLYDNEQLELGDETLSEMMFRKMKGYNVDLNKELGFEHLKPVTKK